MNDIVWVVWLSVVIGSFLVLEWRGLRRRGRSGTLSAQFWRWMFVDEDGKRTPKRRRAFVWFMVVAFFAWLTIHFATGGAV